MIRNSGQIGQKCFVSLTYEINYDRTVGYGDNEMVAAVLKATSPNLCLSNVLETMAGFTLDTLLKFTQGYFEKQNAPGYVQPANVES